MYRLTVGGISQAMASKSQMTPLRTKITVTSVNIRFGYGKHNHRTCFQRMRSKPKLLPDPKRMRGKPMSMMRSKTTSAISEPIILDFMLPGLSRIQVFCSFDHEERTYG